MLDPRWYDGREQALVKHTFLDTYMPAQIPKIVSWANEFTYVDLFAGPWQSKSGDYSDTSFGIALRRMTEAKAKQAELGRKVTMVAHLVEKDPANFAELIDAVKRFPDVEIHCHPGQAEDHASAIATAIPARAFRFVVIDPKGVPDVRKFRCLISPDRTEVLMNFMFQFANRFAGSQDRMPTLEGWLGDLQENGGWRAEFAELRGSEREAAISERARQALRRMGGYKFAPALTVDETAVDRPLYKLIYLTRHPAGIKVFRDAHRKSLETQATYKSAKKAETRRVASGMNDMFAGQSAMEPGERSAREISQGEAAARSTMLQILSESSADLKWKDVWPRVLDLCAVTYGALGDIANDLRKRGLIIVPAWSGDVLRRPKDDFSIKIAPHLAP
ncbi:MAG TPA: three-Cys-motif partner protein TcmP [Sphingopyxis sp.]|jgi:three-Cys-motif partner protein|uniref:three-Cys-motif partner protein TcmP n=1 Tax=Sphingopyxis sp. TaxID=1908224 RepID=UPI002E11F789|nr:three-Cys-motif partner protein TcmP [Sphingopyxis sp.]